MVVFWLESLLVRIDGLQLLLLPAATIASAGALFQGQFVPPTLPWLRAHLLIALAAMADHHRRPARHADGCWTTTCTAWTPAERSVIGACWIPPLLVRSTCCS